MNIWDQVLEWMGASKPKAEPWANVPASGTPGSPQSPPPPSSPPATESESPSRTATNLGFGSSAGSPAGAPMPGQLPPGPRASLYAPVTQAPALDLSFDGSRSLQDQWKDIASIFAKGG
jgi:hypothetical protein